MQENKDYIEGQNVFVDFSIVQNSNATSLSKELDVLIASGKKIYLWSKTVSPKKMELYCKTIKIPTDPKEKSLHAKIFLMRNKDRQTIADIARKLDMETHKVSYYAHANPLREWKLSDWIEGYYVKEPNIYDKVDYLVDNEERLVTKFKRSGRKANLIKEIT